MAKCAEGSEGVHEGNGIRKRNVDEKLLNLCDEKELSMVNLWFYKRKMTYSVGECKTQIDFVIMRKKHKQCKGCDSNCMVTLVQAWLADLDKKVLKKIMRKEIIKRRMRKLNESQTRVRSEKSKRISKHSTLDGKRSRMVF